MTDLKAAAEHLAALSDADLRTLRELIDTLLADREADQRGENAQRGERAVERRWIKRTLADGTVREYGPYLYAKRRVGKTVKSIYLGKGK